MVRSRFLRRVRWNLFESLCEWRRRSLDSPFRQFLRWLAPPITDEERARQAKARLDLTPMDHRNPPSDSWTTAATAVVTGAIGIGGLVLFSQASAALPAEPAPGEAGPVDGGIPAELPQALEFAFDSPVSLPLPAELDPILVAAASPEFPEIPVAPPQPSDEPLGPQGPVGAGFLSDFPPPRPDDAGGNSDPGGGAFIPPRVDEGPGPSLPESGSAPYWWNPRSNVAPGIAAPATKTPLRFVTNQGQWDSSVGYGARGSGYQVWLNSQEAVLTLAPPASLGGDPQLAQRAAGDEGRDVLRFQWVGGNAKAEGAIEERLTSVSNFLEGNDPNNWHTNVPEGSKIRYRNVWDGIDVVYSGTDRRELVFDIAVKPGQDASKASFRIAGARSVRLDEQSGELLIETPTNGTIRKTAPLTYQRGQRGEQQIVASRYRVQADGSVGFEVGEYDRSRELIIDPVVRFASAFGGGSEDAATGVQLDADGNAYTTGWTKSTDFPGTSSGYQSTMKGDTDAFVTKTDATGTIVFSTYYGGSNVDVATGIALGNNGDIYLSGYTNSDDLPVNVPGSGGTISYLTAEESLLGMIAATSDDIAGTAEEGGSYDASKAKAAATTRAGGFDAFVVKLNSQANTLVYGSYLGGVQDDWGYGISVDTTSGQAAIVGATQSSAFPTVVADQATMGSASQAGFVALMSSAGTERLFSTYHGTSGQQAINGVAVSGGSISVVGSMSASGFYTEYAFTGNQTSTTLIGTTADAVTIGNAGDVWITGSATSGAISPTVGAAQTSNAGGSDAFLARFSNPSQDPLYASYLGGSGADRGTGVAIDDKGRVTVAGTSSSLGGTGNPQFLARFAADGGSVPHVYGWGSGGATALPSASALSRPIPAAAMNFTGIFAGSGSQGNDAYLVTIDPRPPAPTALKYDNDTGASSTDRLTNDVTPTLTGSATAGTTVTILARPGNGLDVTLGTTTAGGAGLWTFTYGTLADDTYRFTAIATQDGESSPESQSLTMTLDSTAPTVSLEWDLSSDETTSIRPILTAYIDDLNPLGTIAYLDIDRNDDGDFADTDEFATGWAEIANSSAEFTTYTVLTPGSNYRFRARAFDAAGNEGLSAILTRTVDSQTSNDLDLLQSSDHSPIGGGFQPPSIEDLEADAGNWSTEEDLEVSIEGAKCGCQDASLNYNSLLADIDPIVSASIKSNNNPALGLPSSIIATLTWNGSVAATQTFATTGLTAGNTWQLAMRPTGTFTTGRATFSLDLFFDYAGTANDALRSVNSSQLLVDSSASPFGRGWSFSNVETLIPIAATVSEPAGQLMVYGHGGYAFFEEASGGGFISPAPDRGTLATMTGGGFTYTSPDGRQRTFNATGSMTNWTSRDKSEVFTYTYDSSGFVETMMGPTGARATFVYSSGRALRLESPDGRRTTFAFNGSGDLIKFVNPLGETATLSYDADGRMTHYQRGNRTRSASYVDGRLDTRTEGGRPARQIDPAQIRGLGTIWDRGASVGQITNEVGALIKIKYNQFGKPEKRQAANKTTREWTRNSQGEVTSFRNELGQTTNLSLNSQGRPVSMVRPGGGRVTLVYDTNGIDVIRQIDELNRTTSFTYNSSGQVLTQIDPNGGTTSYTWSSGLLQTITDPEGQVVTYLYDSARRQTGQIVGGVQSSTTIYDDAGNPFETLDTRGNITTQLYDNVGRPTVLIAPDNSRTTSIYDDAGNLAARIAPSGVITSYVYDAAGQQIAVIDGVGTASESRTTTTFDAAGRAQTQIDQYGNVTTTTYDSVDRPIAVQRPTGAITTTIYDAAGRVVATIDPYGAITRQEYDSDGRVEATIDPLNNRTTTVYDAAGNAIAQVNPFGQRTTTLYDAQNRQIGTVDALNNRTTTIYDDAGRIEVTIDALGRRTTPVYDSQNRQIGTIDPLGNRTTTVYDSEGNAINQIDALGRITTTVYDSSNRAVEVIDQLGNRTTTVYDAAGRVEATIDARNNRTTSVYDDRDRVIATIDALNNRTTTVYDSYGRVIQNIDALGKITTTEYDQYGRTVATINPRGTRTETVYDFADRAIATIDPLGYRTTTVYDDAGRVEATIDPLGNRSTSVYDAAGRSVTSINPLGYRTTNVYDAAGRTVASIDALGNRSTTVYDAAGQMIAAIDPLGRTSTTVYDALGRGIAQIDPLGNRTTTVFDAAGQTIASIDALGRINTTIYDLAGRSIAQIDPLNQRITTVYDANGNAVERIDALGRRTTTVYDAVNRPTVQIDALNNRTTTTYDAAGRAITVKDALNRVTTSVYNVAGQQIGTINPLGHATATKYDLLGRVEATSDPLGRATKQFYDEAGRVVATSDPLGSRTETIYDAAGQAIASIDPLGNVTTSVYDAVGRALARIDALGNRTTSVFDAAGQSLAQIDALGNRSTTVYDDAGRSIASIDALGNRSTTIYDAAGQSIASIDPLGNISTSVYDDAGRGIARIDALGNRTTTVYDAAGQTVASIDALGNRSTTVYDDVGRSVAQIDALGNRNTTVYDAVGQAIASIDPLGNRSTTVYDAAGRSVARIDALNLRSTTVYDAAGQAIASINPLNQISTTVYDFSGRAIESIDPLGHRTTTIYDAAGNATERIDPRGNISTTIYDALNRAVAQVDALGWATTTVYDAAGRSIARVDAWGNRSTTVYDAVGRTIAQIDAQGNRSTTIYDAAGNSLATQDAHGFRTTSVYDALNRSIATIDALGNRSTTVYDAAGRSVASIDALNRTSTTVYDAVGRSIAQIDALGNRTTTVYDTAGRNIASIDALGNRTTTVYDNAGRSIASIDSLGNRTTTVYDNAGRVSEQIDALNQTTSTEYDLAGRVVATIDALGNRSTTVYDEAGNATARVDALNRTSNTEYDALNRAYVQIDALGKRTTTIFDRVGNAVLEIDARGYGTTSIYDALGRRIGLIDAAANRSTWTYDAVGRLVSEIDATNASITFAYDAIGRQISTTDRLARRHDTSFDAVGQLTSESWIVSGSPTATNSYGYDAIGRRTSAGNAAGTYTFTFDAAGRVTSVQQPFGATQTFAYDSAGRRTRVEDSFGGVTTSVYDAAGRLTSRQLGGTGTSESRVDWAYTARGQVGTLTRYADVAGATLVGDTLYTYDEASQLINRQDRDSSSSSYADTTFVFDNASRLTDRIENGVSITFGYDATHQVTSDDGTGYSYDGTGNRTNAGYSTGAANRLVSDGTWTWTYDAAGNATTRTNGTATWTYSYDGRGQLTGAQESSTGKRVTFIYDAYGNKVERQAYDGSTSSIQRYVYDGWDTSKSGAIGTENFDQAFELNGSNALVMRRLFGVGFDALLARQTAVGTVSWYVTDQQGSVRQLLDNSGNITGTLAYTAFGERTTSTGDVDEFGYTGRPYDAVLQLQDNRARFLEVKSGRWISEDPIRIAADDPNYYRYVGNNATMGTDPSGKILWVKDADVANMNQVFAKAATPLEAFYVSKNGYNGIWINFRQMNEFQKLWSGEGVSGDLAKLMQAAFNHYPDGPQVLLRWIHGNVAIADYYTTMATTERNTHNYVAEQFGKHNQDKKLLVNSSFTIPGMFTSLAMKDYTKYQLLDFMLKFDGWSIATDKQSASDITKECKRVGSAWDLRPDLVDKVINVDVTPRHLAELENHYENDPRRRLNSQVTAQSVLFDHSENRWMVDLMKKVIYIDKTGILGSTQAMSDALDAIKKEEAEKTGDAFSPINNPGILSLSSTPTLNDPTKSYADQFCAIKGILGEMTVHVLIDAAAQFGTKPILGMATAVFARGWSFARSTKVGSQGKVIIDRAEGIAKNNPRPSPVKPPISHNNFNPLADHSIHNVAPNKPPGSNPFNPQQPHFPDKNLTLSETPAVIPKPGFFQAIVDAVIPPAAPSSVLGTLARNDDLLAKNLGGRIKDHTPHHLIGVAEAQKFDVMKRAAELGYNINRGSNGIHLPNKLDLAKELNLPYHPKRGRHRVDTYTGPVDERLFELQRRYDKGLVNEAGLLDEIRTIEDSIHDDLISGKLRLNSRYPWYPKPQ